MSLDDFKNPMLDAINNSIDEALEGSYNQGRKDAIDEILVLLRGEFGEKNITWCSDTPDHALMVADCLEGRLSGSK